jgi:hypothetical protein
MKKNIERKIKNGKLIRISTEIKKGVLKKIKISGDFFIIPSTGIFDIENAIVNLEINQIKKKLEKVIKEKNIEIIGFSVDDLVSLISE